MRLRLLIALALVAAGLAGVAAPRFGEGSDGGRGSSGRVDRVVDGDTLVVDGEKVRLIGIDTPESVKPGTPVECFAKKASAFTKQLVDHRRVRLVTDVLPPRRRPVRQRRAGPPGLCDARHVPPERAALRRVRASRARGPGSGSRPMDRMPVRGREVVSWAA
jgi:endonuclease YncB( thermonuclease family)